MRQLLDHRGRPMKRAPGRMADRPDRWNDWYVPPTRRSAGLTPSGITRIFNQADDGDPEAQAELFEDMIQRDGRLRGMFETRVKAPGRLSWDLQAASEEATDERIADATREMLEGLKLRKAFGRLNKAVGWGYAADQVEWGKVGGLPAPVFLRRWPERFLRVGPDGRIGRVVVGSTHQPEPMEPGAFLVHQPSEVTSSPVSSGLFRVAAWYWYFKNFLFKAWIQYGETYGEPFRWGTYPAGSPPEEREEAFRNLVAFGRQAAVLLPEGFDLKLIEAAKTAGSGPAVYDRLKAVCDEELAILLLGQTLTSSIGQTGGAFAAAKVHDQVRQDLLEDDAADLADTVTEQLIRPFVGLNFGWDAPLPQFDLQAEREEDLKAVAETLKILAEAGLPIPQAWAHDRVGIRPPEDDEPILRPGSAGAAPSSDAMSAALLAANRQLAGLAAGKACRPATPPAAWRTW